MSNIQGSQGEAGANNTDEPSMKESKDDLPK
jgi:hypothetical protein